ncbi:hypothetical protein F3Y22_tig00117047pilonHSYRG00025 [Hibiscus syriacus]|uniref:Uncharacterized protein n=1 Tax=Hibiscus syriacus TaxID=106335 RepID=A0A6A2WM99_HIBSY|nr:hypothetical protein F3Y22_tig00117047pilonHSYRG00025 [Hibiscus syriacus]
MVYENLNIYYLIIVFKHTILFEDPAIKIVVILWLRLQSSLVNFVVIVNAHPFAALLYVTLLKCLEQAIPFAAFSFSLRFSSFLGSLNGSLGGGNSSLLLALGFCICFAMLKWNEISIEGWPQVLWVGLFWVRPLSFMKKQRAKYGSVFKTRILGCPTVISMDPELNRYILMNEGKGLVPGYPQSMLDILGKCNIAAVHGAAHKQLGWENHDIHETTNEGRKRTVKMVEQIMGQRRASSTPYDDILCRLLHRLDHFDDGRQVSPNHPKALEELRVIFETSRLATVVNGDKSLESHNYCFKFGAAGYALERNRHSPNFYFLHYFVTSYRWEEVGGNEIHQFPRLEAPKGLHVSISNYHE